MNRIHRMQRFRGFSLIELMIALAIGLVLTVVVAQLFVGSRKTYAATDDVSRMQENIRFTYQIMSRTVHLAGYRSSPNVVVSAVFDAANPIITGTNGAGTAADSFTVRYQGQSNGTGGIDNTIVDCLGTPVPAGVMAVNRFFIAPRPDGDGRNALFCDNENDAVPEVMLVANVDNMQVLYGVNTTVGGFSVEQYVDSGAVVPDNVRSLRVALLFETANEGVTPVPDKNKYQLIAAPATVVEVDPVDDTRIRRVVTLTLSLRNRTP